MAAHRTDGSKGLIEDAGFPITEILEALDEDDNIIESTSFPLENSPIASPKTDKVTNNYQSQHDDKPSQPIIQAEDVQPSLTRDDNASSGMKTRPAGNPVKVSHSTNITGEPSREKRKAHGISDHDKDNVESNNHQEFRDLNKEALDETFEDATLRRDMLEYGSSQSPPIVAEFHLDDADANDNYGDGDQSTDQSADDSDAEDENGLSFGRIITAEYFQEMVALEEKLKLKMALAQKPADSPEDPDVVKETPLASNDKKRTKGKGRGSTTRVRFADTVDVAPRSSLQSKPTPLLEEGINRGSSIESEVMSQRFHSSTSKLGRVSQFRRNRSAITTESPKESERLSRTSSQTEAWRDDMSGSSEVSRIVSDPRKHQSTSSVGSCAMPGIPIAEKLVEREPKPLASGSITDVDGLETEHLHQEAAFEYYRRRNRQIQLQGGFDALEKDEREKVPLSEEEGGPRRRSLFMTARARRDK